MRARIHSLIWPLALLPAGVAMANHADDTTELPTVVVTGARGSLTSASVSAQQQQLARTAGSVGFVDSENLQDRYASNLHDVLADTPGVFVETRYGQELRLSIRGSGIARGYHTRGLLILQDGIPTNAADGSGDYYQIDPLALRYTEIYKGGNGLAYGATTLGGAINFVTPTAYTAVAPLLLRLEGGGYGNARAGVQASTVSGNADALFNATYSHSDGWREHSRGDYGQFNGNVGYRIAPDVETRFYLGYYAVNQLLPGALSLTQLMDDPQQASAAAIAGNQARDTRTARIANRSSFKVAGGQIDIDSWYIHKSLNHPIFQVLDEHGGTWGLAPHYSGAFTVAGHRNELYAGGMFFGGNNHAQRYVNNAGSSGALTLDAQQLARNFEAYVEDRWFLRPDLALMAGAKAFSNLRDYRNHGSGAEGSQTYRGVNPKLGLLWLPKKDVQVFADVVRSQDVPDFGDLTQSNSAGTTFVPLATQKAWTVEAGTRGRNDRLDWDLTLYRAELRDELLQYNSDPSIPATTFNADRTRHQGVELGLHYALWRGLFGAGDQLSVGQLWNLNDFRFVGDQQYRDNRIAGVPTQVLRSSLGYRHPLGFSITPTLDWVPRGAYADQANSHRAPGYALLGLQAAMEWRSGVSLFVDARNLGNRRYVSDISTVNSASDTSAIYYPGDGRNVYAGLRYAF